MVGLAWREVERVALYGVSDVTRILFDSLNGRDIRVVGIVDDAYDEEAFHGHRVLRSEALAHLDYGQLLVTSLEDSDAVDARLLALGVDREKIRRIA